MARPRKTTQSNKEPSFADKIQSELQLKQSYLNLFLGFLIVLVVGVLLFNYFKKPSADLGTANQTAQTNTVDASSSATPTPVKDVEVANLPGQYTVKSGDTLYTIAQKYYNDGYQFDKIAQANKLANPNVITPGQVLTIPKPDVAATNTVNPKTVAQQPASNLDNGTGGAINQTMWGERITGTTYTVQSGDWLSTIAGRAYGDIYSFDKIAKANNITDPNVIEPGTVIKIPR